jgi:hypothetical protein
VRKFVKSGHPGLDHPGAAEEGNFEIWSQGLKETNMSQFCSGGRMGDFRWREKKNDDKSPSKLCLNAQIGF